jgi:ketosteroid isomerase-like protein
MRFSFFVLLLFGTLQLAAQDGPEATIKAIFDHMRAADTAGMSVYFHPEATLHSVMTKPDGSTMVSPGSIARWMEGIAGADAGALDEQLHYTELRVDGHLATAWTPYAFMYNQAMHHCGTNAFQMVKDGPEGQWRILHITDTRKNEGCTPVAEESPQATIGAFADAWHQAAADADSTTFFDAMTEDAVYIGTDAGEHWTKEEFLAFAAPYFARGKAWSFKATERHIFYDENAQTAYWDELLDTWMGPCRGTAVLRRRADNKGWQIAHYTLSVTVPNDKIQGFIELTKD